MWPRRTAAESQGSRHRISPRSAIEAEVERGTVYRFDGRVQRRHQLVHARSATSRQLHASSLALDRKTDFDHLLDSFGVQHDHRVDVTRRL
jgi:hypothetical protein